MEVKLNNYYCHVTFALRALCFKGHVITGIYLKNITNQLFCQDRKSILIIYK